MKLTVQQRQIQLLSECDDNRLFWFDVAPGDTDTEAGVAGLDFIVGYTGMPSHFSGVQS